MQVTLVINLSIQLKDILVAFSANELGFHRIHHAQTLYAVNGILP